MAKMTTPAHRQPCAKPALAGIWLALVAVFLAAPGHAAQCNGDAALGAELFNQQCASCHATDADAEAGVGTGLHDLFGRDIGGVAGFDYSDAMANAQGVWDCATLHGFLADPAGYLPGTRMTIDAIDDPEARANLIAFLQNAEAMAQSGSAPPNVPQALLDLPGDIAYGEYLAAECLGCHQTNAQSGGVPAITGWPVAPFLSAMLGYRDGQRDNAAMNLVARRLGDEELAALAAYFETIK